MGRLVLECFDRKIRLRKIAKAVYKVLGQKDKLRAEIVFSDGENMRNLNNTTRGVDSVTDVLSYPTLDGVRGEILYRKNFPLEVDGSYLCIGSIVLCDEVVRAQAIEYGHSEERERTYLIVHGLMHLFGYDHMTDEDKAEMRKMEKAALALLKVSQ